MFPLAPGSKFPLAGSSAHYDASSDPEQIRAWFEASPDLNVGIDLERSGLVVLDVDVAIDKHTGRPKPGLAALAELGDLPATLAQRTARGGLQAFYQRGADDVASRKVCIPTPTYPKGSGLDLFGKGYVLAPPSVITGREFEGAAPGATGRYEWLTDAPIAPLPSRLAVAAALVRAPAAPSDTSPRGPASERVIRAARDRLDRHGPAIQGQGGNAHTRAAWGILVHNFGLSEAEALPLLAAWNLTCKPPWEFGELRKGPARGGQDWTGPYAADRDALEGGDAIAAMLDEIDGAAPAAEPGSGDVVEWVEPAPGASMALGALAEPPAPLTPWEQELTRARADVARVLAAPDDRAASARPPLFEPAGTLFTREYPATPWLVRGLITERGTTLVLGEPKTSKTWGLVEIALAVSTGTQAFAEFETGKPRTVAYFFAEDHAEFVRNRIRALCASRGVEGDAILEYVRNLYVRPRGAFLDITRDEDMAWIIASCRMIGQVDMLILEPLRDIHSAEEDSSDDMANVMRRLRALGEIIGCTPAAAHHMNKGSSDTKSRRPGQRARGSGAIHGSIDCGLYFEDLRGDGMSVYTNKVTSEVKGARGAGVFDLTLTIVDDVQSKTAISATWTKTDAKEAKAAEASSRADAICNLIRSSPDQVLSKNAIVKLAKGNRNAVLLLIDDMVARGVLRAADRHPITGAPVKAGYAIGTVLVE